MADIARAKRFKAGEVIFKEGDPPGALYMIEKGVVEISKGEGDAQIALAERKENEVFGEMALVDHQPRSATATAKTDVETVMIFEEELNDYLGNLHPAVFHVFLSLVSTIREMNETQALLANVLKLRERAG